MSAFQIIEPGSISEWVWDNKYRLKKPDGTPIDDTINDTFLRVALAVAKKENDRNRWAGAFYDAMQGFGFLPAGRILAGAGTDRSVTLFNCYVMGTIEDSLFGIMHACTEAALTLKQGGGVGMDFSTLRPRGALVRGVDSASSGAVSFMAMWDSMCGTIMSAGTRRGAMMAVLRCDHPDIEEFIDAKKQAGRLTNFNVSVAITDAFMSAVALDAQWGLHFGGELYRTVRARELWEKILRSTYDYAEPGVIFIDRVNAVNPLRSIENIAASNPCGEQMLPSYGACLLGSINLARLVDQPFSASAQINFSRLEKLTTLAVRFLDNVIDVSRYPLEQQEREAKAKRRIGLGITGLADALIMLGIDYRVGGEVAGRITRKIEETAMLASMELAEEKGAFPLWKMEMGQKRRNSHLMSIAPTGTISALAGNVSSGVEPVFDVAFKRNVLMPDGSKKQFGCEDYASRLFKIMRKDQRKGPEWVTANELTPSQHLAMVAACQPHIDSAISKTINCPESMPFDEFKGVYGEAYKLNLKGCTTYRPSGMRGAVLVTASEEKKAQDPTTVGNVVQLGKPLARPKVIDGKTYKIKPAGAEHALYVTLNDIEQDGRMRPFEIFFNSKAIDGYAWTVALSRMISAVFRKGGDVAFVVDELKSVFDPRGGYWQDGKYVPSVCAAIGGVIEQHMQAIGFADADQESVAAVALRHCPKCQAGALQNREGCWSCMSCDYTTC